MTTSRVPQVLDYLVTLFKSASTLTGVLILDGPEATADPAQQVLWVGVDDPDATNGTTAASSEQDWAGLGRQARNEHLTVFCTAQAWSGVESYSTQRATTTAIVAAVEDLIRGDATLGGNVSVPGNAAVTGAQWRQGPSGNGPMARVTFTIEAKARIGG